MSVAPGPKRRRFPFLGGRPEGRRRPGIRSVAGKRRWRWRPIVAAVAGVAVVAAAGVVFVASRGGAGGGGNGATAAAGFEPNLPLSAARYAPALNELPGNYEDFPPDTYQFTLQLFAGAGPFDLSADGEALAGQWGYADGFQGVFRPDALLAGVLRGQYFITTETHLFNSIEGAKAAFQTYDTWYSKIPGSEKVEVRLVGNEAIAFRLDSDPILDSGVAGVFYRVIFRRGNLVGVAQTYGAEPYMNIDRARAVAEIIDGRALGRRVASEPTPPATATGR